MRRRKLTSNLLIFAGCAQLALALCGAVYTFRPTPRHESEPVNIEKYLRDPRPSARAEKPPARAVLLKTGLQNEQRGLARISGRVTDVNGKGLKGVELTLRPVMQVRSAYTEKTRADGRYVFRVPRGDYKLYITFGDTDPNGMTVYASERDVDGNDFTMLSQPPVLPTPPPTPTPKPTPTPPTPTPTPTPDASNVSGNRNFRPAPPPPAAPGTPQLKASWPKGLARGWRDSVVVEYTPPADEGRLPAVAEGELYAVVEVPVTSGLRVVSRDDSQKRLGREGQRWVFDVEPDEGAGAMAACELRVEIRRGRGGGEDKIVGAEDLRYDAINVVERPLTERQSLGGTVVLGVSGLATVGLGALRRKAGAGAARRETVACHFRAEIEDEVVVRRVTTVEVLISLEEIERAAVQAGGSAEARVVADEELVLRAARLVNFELVDEAGDEEKGVKKVLPPAEGKPAKVYFDLRPCLGDDGQEGEGEVSITVMQSGVVIATLELKTRIVRERGAAGRRASAEVAAPAAPVPAGQLNQLLIHEQYNNGVITYEYVLNAPGLGIVGRYMSDPIRGDRQQYIEGIYRRIEQRRVTTRDDARAFAEALRAEGGALFTQLFPAPLQEALWRHRDRIKSIMVISAEPFIPWELVHLKQPGRQHLPANEVRFLGQMGLVRWLYGAEWPPEQIAVREGRVRYVIPSYPHPDDELPGAADERAFLESMFKATPVEPQSEPVLKLIFEPDSFDLLHFACHGVSEHGNLCDGDLMLEGRMEDEEYVGDSISAVDVGGSFRQKRTRDKNRPMVVVNACQLGRTGYSLCGIGGFSEAFVRGGAGAFVGTLWAVGDTTSSTFIKTFYERLYEKSDTLAEATVAARRKARRAEGADVSTWLAYVVYGNPHMRLKREHRPGA